MVDLNFVEKNLKRKRINTTDPELSLCLEKVIDFVLTFLQKLNLLIEK